VFANLKEKKLVGFPSHGMVLCAHDKDRTVVKVVTPPADSNPGDVVTIDGVEGNNWELGAKKLDGLWKDASSFLRTDNQGLANFNGQPLKVNGNTFKAEINDGWIS